jgi:hypothetical protein
MGNVDVYGVDGGKLVKWNLTIGAPKLDGLEGDKLFEFEEYELSKSEYNEPRDKIECSTKIC